MKQSFSRKIGSFNPPFSLDEIVGNNVNLQQIEISIDSLQIGPQERNFSNDKSFFRFVQDYLTHTFYGLAANIREVSEEDVKSLKNHDKNLYYMPQSSANSSPVLKLGDRVRITLKHRQFKQVVKSGWNALMNNDCDQVGTIIGLTMADMSIATVFYQRSGQCWTIGTNALDKVDECGSSKSESFNNLKVGDYVEIDKNLSDFARQVIQRNYLLPDAGLKKYLNSFEKILAFDLKGAAIVSINEYKSMIVHPGLLKKVTRTSNPKSKTTFSKKTIKSDIKDLIRSPYWVYSHTEIIGEQAKILRRIISGEYQILVKEKTYRVNEEYFVKKEPKKSRNRRSGDRSRKLDFPFEVGNFVQLKKKFLEKLKELPRNLRLVSGLYEVLQDFTAVFKGYNSNGTVALTVDWPSSARDFSTWIIIHVPISWLEKSQAARSKDRKKLKVVTSNAKLLAFDDDRDEALLQFDDQKVYALPSDFVDIPFDRPPECRAVCPPDLQLTPMFHASMFAYIAAKAVLTKNYSGSWKIEQTKDDEFGTSTTILYIEGPIEIDESFGRDRLLHDVGFSLKTSHFGFPIDLQFLDQDSFMLISKENIGRVIVRIVSMGSDPTPGIEVITEDKNEASIQADCGEGSNESDPKETKDENPSQSYKNTDLSERKCSKKDDDHHEIERPHCSRMQHFFDHGDPVPQRRQTNDVEVFPFHPVQDERRDDSDLKIPPPPSEEHPQEPLQPLHDNMSESDPEEFIENENESDVDEENADEHEEEEYRDDDLNVEQPGNVLERRALMTVNRETNEVTMKGNLGADVLNGGGRPNQLSRQSSRVEAQTPGVYGGEGGGDHYFNNCSFPGQNYFSCPVLNQNNSQQEMGE